MSGSEVEEIIYQKLSKFGFTSENTLYADSSCPDEINHNDPEEDITSLLTQRWGEIFPLGGLGGLPFTGKTGWGAMSSHVPENGNIVVLYAPHVGIDSTGIVGKIKRQGQHQCSTACGAAIGAYNAVKCGPTTTEFKPGYMDYQMDSIKHLVSPHVKEIQAGKDENVTLAYTMYDISGRFIDEIANMNFGGPSSKLAVIGGIMINCEGKGTDKFLPLKFEVIEKSG